MVTPLQEKMFCTLGGNIPYHHIEDGFDACQQLVKRSFDDQQLMQGGLNSATRLMALF
jgi:threonine synthase